MLTACAREAPRLRGCEGIGGGGVELERGEGAAVFGPAGAASRGHATRGAPAGSGWQASHHRNRGVAQRRCAGVVAPRQTRNFAWTCAAREESLQPAIARLGVHCSASPRALCESLAPRRWPCAPPRQGWRPHRYAAASRPPIFRAASATRTRGSRQPGSEGADVAQRDVAPSAKLGRAAGRSATATARPAERPVPSESVPAS